jgi:hypothetical protein
MHVSREVRQRMGLAFDPDPDSVLMALLRDAHAARPEFNPPRIVVEWLAKLADNCYSIAALKSPVTVDPNDPDGDPAQGLHLWMAPAVLAVISPHIAIPTGEVNQLLSLCRTEVRNQLPAFCGQVVQTWKTGEIPHGTMSV